MTRSAARLSGHRRHLTIRTRLTLTFAALVLGCGTILIALVYLYMRFVPSYEFQDAVPLGGRPAPTDTEQTASTAALPAVSSVEGILANILIASIIALAVMAVLGGALGWYLAGRTLKPLVAINDAARRAASGALDHRISTEGPDDEIAHLSDTFDTMLASLERSFAAHQRFAANASHELRTPLATTKTMIDVVLADPDASGDELRALAERIRKMNDANVETVDALLDLAVTEGAALRTERIDIGAIAHAVVRGLMDVAEDADVQVKVTAGTIPIDANPVLVERAIDNLVRNAIRYNHPGGNAIVRVSQDEHGVHVAVSNTGARIAPETVDALIEPFFRGAGRGRVTGEGHGLGLALVSSVARAHGGTFALEANPHGGLTARLNIPGL